MLTGSYWVSFCTIRILFYSIIVLHSDFEIINQQTSFCSSYRLGKPESKRVGMTTCNSIKVHVLGRNQIPLLTSSFLRVNSLEF